MSQSPPSTLQWRHNEHDAWRLFTRWFRRRSKKTSKLHVTRLCEGNSPVAGEFSAHKGPVMQKTFPFDNVIMWHVSGRGRDLWDASTGYFILQSIHDEPKWKLQYLQCVSNGDTTVLHPDSDMAPLGHHHRVKHKQVSNPHSNYCKSFLVKIALGQWTVPMYSYSLIISSTISNMHPIMSVKEQPREYTFTACFHRIFTK